MPRKTDHVRSLYAQIPLSLHDRLETCLVKLKQDKRVVVIDALEYYLPIVCPDVPPTKPGRKPRPTKNIPAIAKGA